MSNTLVNGLMSFIDQSPSMFHAADTIISQLESNGFSYLDPSSNWNLEVNGKYYVTSNQSAVIAFIVNSTAVENEGFKIVGAHTDVPGFRIKPNPQMTTESYVKLNTEIYGGPILNTWLDRPLSAAGRVALKSDNVLRPTIKLVDLERPLLIIPNLAIHMNRDVNNGVKLNAQKETLPVVSYVKEKLEGNIILEEVAKKLNVAPSDILEMDLFLYPTEKSCMLGLNE